MRKAEDFFAPEHRKIICEALYVSEDIVNNYFWVSDRFWAKNSYEICTLKEAKGREYPGKSFAHLIIYSTDFWAKKGARDNHRHYRICLNDFKMLQETAGGEKKHLFPLLIYILTHELIHIVRFAKFECLPVMDKKEIEERRVHELTQNMLPLNKVKGLKQVIDKFKH